MASLVDMSALIPVDIAYRGKLPLKSVKQVDSSRWHLS
jgi:hypothetical protein